MTAPSKQVATQSTRIGEMVSQYKEQFALVLPSSVPAAMFVRLAEGKLRTDRNLREAAQKNPDSLFATLMECARLGHEPGTDEFALIPWPNKNAVNGVEVMGIEQYQGVVERMLNSGVVVSVKAQVVRESDYFDPREDQPFTPPDHRPGWYLTDPPGQAQNPWLITHEDRGKLIGVYAYAIMESGAISRVVTMPRDEVMWHKAHAKTTKFWDNPAIEPDMWIKTAVHKLTSWVPTSAEQANRRAERAQAAPRQRTEAPGLDPTRMRGETGSVQYGEVDDRGVVDAQVVPEGTTTA